MNRIKFTVEKAESDNSAYEVNDGNFVGEKKE